MENYKYTSENTLSDISLHDCSCKKISREDGDLIFTMEFMEVCSEHKLNPFPLAHQTGEGKIIFKNAEVKKCLFDDYDLLANKKTLADFCPEDLTVLDYDENPFKDKYLAKIFMIFLPGEEYYGITLEIAFEKSIVMWNEFRNVSWFEPFNKGAFMWNNIRALLDFEDKSFMQKHNDLYTVINLVFKKREKGPGYSEKIYKLVLGEELYNHELNDIEEEYIINFFKCLIIRHSELDIYCIGCLGKYPKEEEYNFLFDQLKESIFQDECLAVALLRELNFWQNPSYTEYLDSIKDSDKLSQKLKAYIHQTIKFKTHKITNMSEPSVGYDDSGKNRYIEWGRI